MHPATPRLPAFLAAALLACPAAAAPVEFNRDVRPILSDTCFTCHGPDRNKRKADLRLDTEAGVRKVVVPGDPDKSELFRRVTAH
ncbi:MAG TPA: c-type cytochrome domain-containing protein, partial [Gemmataceae bacterium]|nr:c-type cytochrome domain-containing protein [Gemmataceae bacterium]